MGASGRPSARRGKPTRGWARRDEKLRAAAIYVAGGDLTAAGREVGRPHQTVSRWYHAHDPYDWDAERARHEGAVISEVARTSTAKATADAKRALAEWQRRHELTTDQIEAVADAILRAGVIVKVDREGHPVLNPKTGLPTVRGQTRPDRMALAYLRLCEAVAKRRGLAGDERVVLEFTPETAPEAWRWLKLGVSRALARALVASELEEQVAHRIAERFKVEVAAEFEA